MLSCTWAGWSVFEDANWRWISGENLGEKILLHTSFSSRVFIFFTLTLSLLQDHAPGSLLISEANGIVSDSRGQPLDFGLGRDLGENYGVIATGKDVHEALIAAIKKALDKEKTM